MFDCAQKRILLLALLNTDLLNIQEYSALLKTVVTHSNGVFSETKKLTDCECSYHLRCIFLIELKFEVVCWRNSFRNKGDTVLRESPPLNASQFSQSPSSSAAPYYPYSSLHFLWVAVLGIPTSLTSPDLYLTLISCPVCLWACFNPPLALVPSTANPNLNVTLFFAITFIFRAFSANHFLISCGGCFDSEERSLPPRCWPNWWLRFHEQLIQSSSTCSLSENS